jgi:PAS domain-containing protein
MLWTADGWEGSDACGRPIDRSNFPLMRAMRGVETLDAQEVLLRRPDGSQIWVSLTATPVRSEKGDLLGGVLVVQDIDAAHRERERLLELATELTQVISRAAQSPTAERSEPKHEVSSHAA